MIQTIAGFMMCLAASVAFAEDKPKPTSAKNPALRKELIRRTKPDQEVRKKLMELIGKRNKSAAKAKTGPLKKPSPELLRLIVRLKKIDAENTKWLKHVVAKHGWPTVTQVGNDGSRAAWLLVQHADAEPKFQRRCLDLMSKVPNGEVSRANVAYLTDRVLLAEGKKQLYGTQFHLVGGKWEPKPLKDPANVDKRRAAVGLSTLEEYAKLISRRRTSGKKKPTPPTSGMKPERAIPR